MTRARLSQVALIMRRELRDQLRDWRILFPLVVLTLFFPFLMNFTARVALDFVAQYGANLMGERIVPFLLMVVGFFPSTVSLVVALEAFVGEKERGTIEPLLSAPLEDWQLYLGKLLSSTILPILASYFGISVYLAGLLLQGVPLPDRITLVQTVILTSIQAIMMVSGAMIISAQSTTVRAANLLASFIIVPVALLVQGESALMFWGNSMTLWLTILGVLILTVLLVRVGLVHFQRENMLGREIDTLNFKWIGQTLWGRFKGEANTPWQWYRHEIPQVLYRIRHAVLILFLLLVLSVTASYFWMHAQIQDLPDRPDSESIAGLIERLGPEAELAGTSIIPGYLIMHNARALVAIFVVGSFSFSVAGTLIFFLNSALIGVALAAFEVLGYSPLAILALGILPHGVFELTALILTTAVVMHIGALLVTPNARLTFTDVYINGLADWLKVTLGLGLPLLVIAALIEAYVTPVLLASIVNLP